MPAIEFGIDSLSFREKYVDRSCLLVRNAVAPRAIDWPELDSVLQSVDGGAPALQLFRNGPVDESEFTTSAIEFGSVHQRLDKARFMRLLHAGATLVVNRFERHSATARHLCEAIGRFAGGMPVGNAYLSIGGSGTFGRHWDTHDVFAVQSIGRKRWQIFAPTFELPTAGQSSSGREGECSAEPLLDVVLGEGDLLYLPRGFWHHAIPLEGPSLHLSVGVYQPTVADYLSWVCMNLPASSLDARRSLGLEEGPAHLAAALERLRSLATDPRTRPAFESDLRRRQRSRPQFNTGVFFETGPDGLSTDALITPTDFGVSPSRASAGTSRREHSDAGRAGQWPSDSPARTVLDVLAMHSSLTLGALLDALPEMNPRVVRVAVLDLELNEIVNVTRP